MVTIYRRKRTSAHAGKPGRFRVEFEYAARRHSLTIGFLTKLQAQEFRVCLRRLIASRNAGLSLDPSIELWAGQFSPKIYKKLAEVGLLPRSCKGITLGQQLDELRRNRISAVGEAARSQAHRALSEYFGDDKKIVDITPEDARRWWVEHAGKSRRGNEISQATRAKRLKDAKAVFNMAVRSGVISKNPLSGVSGGSQVNVKRQRFIAISELEYLRDFVSKELFALLALARMAGTRCPSEVRPLTWCDIDFASKQLTIKNAKLGAGGNKGPFRLCPLRDKLVEILLELRPAEWTPEMPVFPDIEGSPVRNPWQQLSAAFERAKITPWVKPFPNLRGSFITDLRAHGISHVRIGQWAGNSTTIGDLHYDLPFDDQYQRAINAECPMSKLRHAA
jgi:integrase